MNGRANILTQIDLKDRKPLRKKYHHTYHKAKVACTTCASNFSNQLIMSFVQFLVLILKQCFCLHRQVLLSFQQLPYCQHLGLSLLALQQRDKINSNSQGKGGQLRPRCSLSKLNKTNYISAMSTKIDRGHIQDNFPSDLLRFCSIMLSLSHENLGNKHKFSTDPIRSPQLRRTINFKINWTSVRPLPLSSGYSKIRYFKNAHHLYN